MRRDHFFLRKPSERRVAGFPRDHGIVWRPDFASGVTSQVVGTPVAHTCPYVGTTNVFAAGASPARSAETSAAQPIEPIRLSETIGRSRGLPE